MQIKKTTRDNCKTFKFTSMDGDVEIGHAYLYVIYNDSEDIYYGLLADVKVDEKYRAQGIGTQLVKDIIEEAKQQKCSWLFGTSRYSRTHVHKWYENLGFTDYGKNFLMRF